jgi:hypothetical protein
LAISGAVRSAPDLWTPIRRGINLASPHADKAREIAGMAERVVRMKLNQQQLELIDRTVAQGAAPTREELVLRALREMAAKRGIRGAAKALAGGRE